jgi:subtilase family serine protease
MPSGKSFLVLFFKKERLLFFFKEARMRIYAILPACALAIAGAAHAAPDLQAQAITAPGGMIIIPGSSHPRGKLTAHTNVRIFVPSGRALATGAPYGKFETPASLACVYGVAAKTKGCNPETLTKVANTGSRIIAIVDAYDDATAVNDLNVYSQQFGLPPITADNFEIVYASGKKPKEDPTGGWELEESLDIEMAHALAPNAKIVLVEAKSNAGGALLAAEHVAAALVQAAGGGEVSNSWASGEFPAEARAERYFKADGVVFFAAAGDSPGAVFPSVLPDVVSVGGTTIDRNGAGAYQTQSTWSTSGGGLSAYIATPAYQNAVTNIVGTQRGTPDIALDANPASGVWVYDTTPYSGTILDWLIVGGTSAASPEAAALVNSAGSFNASGKAELTEIYDNLGDATVFFDITEGSCVNAASQNASVGYDLCTGVGAPLGLAGK